MGKVGTLYVLGSVDTQFGIEDHPPTLVTHLNSTQTSPSHCGAKMSCNHSNTLIQCVHKDLSWKLAS